MTSTQNSNGNNGVGFWKYLNPFIIPAVILIGGMYVSERLHSQEITTIKQTQDREDKDVKDFIVNINTRLDNTVSEKNKDIQSLTDKIGKIEITMARVEAFLERLDRDSGKKQ